MSRSYRSEWRQQVTDRLDIDDGYKGGVAYVESKGAMYGLGVKLVSNAMQKLGEVMGFNTPKYKLVAGLVPDAEMGVKLAEQTSRFSGGTRVQALFQVPKALTLDIASAAQWYRTQMGQLSSMVDRSAPLAEQLAQAEKLQALLLKAAAHGLADPELAATFREAFVRPGVQDLMTKFGGPNGLSGQALQEKVLSELTSSVDNLRRWFEPGACFAAGTLVHTKEGLKPIEQIQVGDWVLSKPENGGEQAYKRVLKTFEHPPERVVEVQYLVPSQDGMAKRAEAISLGRLVTTTTHPFWTQEDGWTAAIDLLSDRHFEDRNGNAVQNFYVQNIYISDQPNVGWTSRRKTVRTDDLGHLWDYANNKLIATDVPPIDAVEYFWDGDTVDENLYFKLPVYNLEVEDFHTYYVGEHGLWVHNDNCAEATLEVAAGKGDVAELLKGVLQFGNEGHFKQLTKAELNQFLKNDPNTKEGIAIIRMDGAGKVAELELGAKVLETMRKVAAGCFIAGTLVHTKEGLKRIEQIQVGDWVLSRPEDPEQGTETGYKRVTKTFRFENKEVVRFWWTPQPGDGFAKTESVYVTPNHPVWLNPNGWVAMGRLYLPEKLRPGTIHRGNDQWLNKELVLADGSTGAMLDVMDLFCTNNAKIAFGEEDDPDWGWLVDFSGSSPKFVPGELGYDYEQWGDPVNETRERYTTTVYNFEVEDWHTYFVGKTGLWVHNTNCAEATLEVAAGKGRNHPDVHRIERQRLGRVCSGRLPASHSVAADCR